MRLPKQEPDATEPVGRGALLQKILTSTNGVLIPARGDHRFQLEQAWLRVIDCAIGISEEERNWFSGLAGDMLESRKGRASPARFDQIDCRRGDVTPTHLGEA
jgi:hypothetical protein